MAAIEMFKLPVSSGLQPQFCQRLEKIEDIECFRLALVLYPVLRSQLVARQTFKSPYCCQEIFEHYKRLIKIMEIFISNKGKGK